jgi:hypothetical protein
MPRLRTPPLFPCTSTAPVCRLLACLLASLLAQCRWPSIYRYQDLTGAFVRCAMGGPHHHRSRTDTIFICDREENRIIHASSSGEVLVGHNPSASASAALSSTAQPGISTTACTAMPQLQCREGPPSRNYPQSCPEPQSLPAAARLTCLLPSACACACARCVLVLSGIDIRASGGPHQR